MTPRASIRTRSARIAVAALLLSAFPVAFVAVGGTAGAVVIECSGEPQDINGDGFADVAVGEPDGGSPAGGRAHVLYGTTSGLATSATGDAPDDQVFAQGVGGISGVDTAGDGFGATTLVKDLNGDGCADVAIGVPGNSQNAGAVVVLYGSVTGLTTTGSEFITPDEVPGGRGARNESFGFSLAAGDFDADGVNDLAVGIPFATVAEEGLDRGSIAVLYGEADGLEGHIGSIVVHQDSQGFPGASEDGDAFGFALAAQDVTGDGIDDVVVGVPGENDGAGIVQVLDGSAVRFNERVVASTWSEDSAGVPGAAESGDSFGFAVAAGDVDGDGDADLVAGVPGENDGHGAVSALFSDAAGKITGTGAQILSQDTAGVDGVAGRNDFFAYSVAVAPLDGDGFADLVVGIPNDAFGATRDAGTMALVRGSAAGLSTAGYGGSRVSQETAGVAGSAEPGDAFGRTVATAAVQGSSVHNVLVGIPGEDVGPLADAGLSLMLAATAGGPSGAGSQTLGADTAGVAGAARAAAFWGVGLD